MRRAEIEGERGVPLFVPPDGAPAHVVTSELVEAHHDEVAALREVLAELGLL